MLDVNKVAAQLQSAAATLLAALQAATPAVSDSRVVPPMMPAPFGTAPISQIGWVIACAALSAQHSDPRVP